MPRSTCPLCRGWGGAHFHWCTEVGGAGRKPTTAPVKRSPKAAPKTPAPESASLSAPVRAKQPTGGGEPPVGPTPAPAALPSTPPVRACRECHMVGNHKLDCSQQFRQPRGRTRITEPEPEYPRTEARRIIELRERTAEATPAERWRWLAGEAGQVNWERVDDDVLGSFAHRMRDFCAGHGLPITVKIREDVLAVDGFDEEAVRAALSTPDRVEVRPESWHKDKRYPVLAFRRGDVIVIVGLRFADAPAVIAAYWTSLLSGYDPTAHRDRTGGGGAKLSGGQPTTIKALVKRITMMGATLPPDWAQGDEPVTVTYDGQDLGKIPVSPRTSRAEIESAWSRTMRRIQAIDQRAAGRRGA